MRITDLLNDYRKEKRVPFSFEFFPPKTDRGWESLYSAITNLIPLHPAYVSVTYGAGGSTRDNTHRLVSRLHKSGLPVVAHLTCQGSSQAEIDAILSRYDREGIKNILALKGDVSKERQTQGSAFYYAADLVAYARSNYSHFGIGVAGFPEGHPDSRNRLLEMDYLKQKIDAGADYIVTQLFFDNRDFYDYCERCELAGIAVPIIAGIMPVTTESGLNRMAELSARARFPAKLLKALGRTSQPAAFEQVGIHWATEQIGDLLHNNVAGIHLYTLNNSVASVEICRNLGLSNLAVRA